jgi:hypothetical protein
LIELKEEVAAPGGGPTEYAGPKQSGWAWLIAPSGVNYCLAFWQGGTQTGFTDPQNANDGPVATITLPEGPGTYTIAVGENAISAPNIAASPPAYISPRFLAAQSGNVFVAAAQNGSGTFTPANLNAPYKPDASWPCPWPVAGSGVNYDYGPFP